MFLSEKIKGIHNQIPELVQCPDQNQTCQEYYFNENSRIIDLVSKIQSYHANFSEKSSIFNASSSKSSSSNSKSSSKNIQFEKAKAKLIVSQATLNQNYQKNNNFELEKEEQKLADAENKLQLAQLAERFNQYNAYGNFELDKDIQIYNRQIFRRV